MQIYGATDIGTKRHTNQDAFVNTVLSHNAVLSVVCDGMGGANAGNIASSIATASITDYIKRSFVPEIQLPSIKNLLFSAIDTANTEVFRHAQTSPEFEGMGTTAVVALIIGETAYIAHVGDSRAYLVSETECTRLTNDHSVVQTLVEKGHITLEEAKNHPERNIITRAIGINEVVEPDFISVSVNKSSLLLCTDGLSNVVSESDMLILLGETPFDKLPEALIKTANSLDSGDNVTVTAIALDELS